VTYYSSMSFTLCLFGSPAIELEDGSWQDIANTKPALLLLYLAFVGDWVSRGSLATLLQPDGDDENVRRYLRVLLNRTKDFSWAGALEIESKRLKFAAYTDVQQFQAAIATEQWSVAYGLHKKPLLEGFVVRDAPALDAWLELERERLTRAWNLSALRHAQNLSENRNHTEAMRVFEGLLQYDPLQEDVVVAFMRQCARTGSKLEAIRAFERFRTALETELALEPMPATLELLEQIRRSQVVVDAPVVKSQPIAKDLLRPPRLIGRETEMTAFQNSSAKINLFLAEAGAGKTRLLEEIAPVQARWWYCREGLEGVPYQPITQWIRGNLNAIPELGAYIEDLARLVPEIAPNQTFGPGEPSSAKARLLEALTRVFEASPNPIMIDDLQWIDSSSLEALTLIASRGHVAIVAAVRGDEINTTLEETLSAWRGQGVLQEIKLEPLRPESLQALIEDVTEKNAINKDICQWLSENAGGNAFFVLETLRDLIEHGAVTDPSELRIPNRVQHLIERRFKRLSQTTQRVLQAASVMREGFTPQYLSGMIGISEFAALDALEETERAGFIAGYRFQHDLVRQSMYKSIQETRRKSLHARVATILEPLTNPAIVGNHWLEAGELTKAVPKIFVAADQQHYLGNGGAAIALLENILDQKPGESLKNKIRIKMAIIFEETKMHTQLEATIVLLLNQNLEPLERVEVLDIQSNYFNQYERIEDICRVLEEATNILKRFDPNELSSKLRLIPAKLAYYQDDLETTLIAYVTELEHQKNSELNADLVALYSDVASAYGAVGDFENSECMALKSYQLAQRLKIRHLQVGAAAEYGAACIGLKKYEQWLAIGEEALALGNYVSTDVVRNNLVSSYSLLGRHDDVIHHSEILARESSFPKLRAASWSRIAQIHVKHQRLPEAEQAFENTLIDLPEIQDDAAIASIVINLIEHGNARQQTVAASHFSRISTKSLSERMNERLALAKQKWQEQLNEYS
jgi:DNA-binding SARP family transcriptional activator/tetratricopeptide (TPR) repeat protein